MIVKVLCLLQYLNIDKFLHVKKEYLMVYKNILIKKVIHWNHIMLRLIIWKILGLKLWYINFCIVFSYYEARYPHSVESYHCFGNFKTNS